MLMPIDTIPDWEMRLKRQDAFWDNEIIDRPVAAIYLPKPEPDPAYPGPQKAYATLRDRWLDPEYHVQWWLSQVMNTEFLGDALPYAYPNLGPEVFSAYFGCEMEFGEGTSWSIPNLLDWADADTLVFSEDNDYWRKTLEVTDALLEAGKGRFYTGFTDLHPGADAIAAFRDPQQMNIDMLEAPEEIKRLLDRVTEVFFHVYDLFHAKLTAAGQAITTWPGIVSTRKWHVPSNDFSCMVSKAMFDEFFLPGISAECRHMEANIYHLDGPNALRHLDSLLSIPELNVIQWTFGAGNEPASRWMDVYRKCQAAGKGLQIPLSVTELDAFMDNLKPNGLWLNITGIRTREEAEAVLRKLARWT